MPHAEETMPPRLWTLFLAALTAAGASVSAHANPVSITHIRCLDSKSRQILQDGLSHSHTVGLLADRIEHSDVVVMMAVRWLDGGFAGKTQIITSAPGARYLMVTLDPRAPSFDLVGRLGHELQHVAEIAAAPRVKDEESLRALFKRIGYPNGWIDGDNWETSAAIETGRQAAREASERPSHVTDLVENRR
jgi:hypothetical protein